MTNLRKIRDKDETFEGIGKAGCIGKREKIKRFIDGLPSGTEFETRAVAKLADLSPVSAIGYIRQFKTKFVGKGVWMKV